MSQRHRCALLAVVFVAGCAIWRPLPGAGFAAARSDHLDHARVVLRDGSRTELEDVTINRDSIIGFHSDSATRFAVARSEVTRVDAWQPDGAKSFAAGALITASVLAVYVMTLIILLSREGT
jgi:hypothetical protein